MPSMTISLVHVSDIHFGSGESHGRINPATGLNVRFEDFVLALSKVVDFAIQKDCDIFLFSGDAYRNASPDPIYQKMFATQLKRLSDAQIPVSYTHLDVYKRQLYMGPDTNFELCCASGHTDC